MYICIYIYLYIYIYWHPTFSVQNLNYSHCDLQTKEISKNWQTLFVSSLAQRFGLLWHSDFGKGFTCMVALFPPLPVLGGRLRGLKLISFSFLFWTWAKMTTEQVFRCIAFAVLPRTSALSNSYELNTFDSAPLVDNIESIVTSGRFLALHLSFTGNY